MAPANKGLADLLRWSLENTPAREKPPTSTTTATLTDTPQDGTTVTAIKAIEDSPTPTASAGNQEVSATPPPPRSDNADILDAIFGGPSDAELMRAAIELITTTDDEVTLETRLTAFDNLEQLIESLDNANDLEVLDLWTPLLGCLTHAEPDMRRMAAWCVGTAVQNNARTQERLVAMGGIPTLVAMAAHDGDENEAAVRKKAQYALSCAMRNYQPATDLCSSEMARRGKDTGKVDAADMEAISEVLNILRG